MKIKKPSLVIILLLCLWLLSNSIAWAAPTPEASEEQKLTEQENIRELDAIPVKPPPKEKTLSIKTGGWFTSLFRYYQNTDNDAGIEDTEAWSLYEDLRLWAHKTESQNVGRPFVQDVRDLILQSSLTAQEVIGTFDYMKNRARA